MAKACGVQLSPYGDRIRGQRAEAEPNVHASARALNTPALLSLLLDFLSRAHSALSPHSKPSQPVPRTALRLRPRAASHLEAVAAGKRQPLRLMALSWSPAYL